MVDTYNLPKIAAVDFDGTLVEDKFPNIGDIIPQMFDICLDLKARGVKLILWTCRDNDTPEKYLDQAVNFCKAHGLVFDSVNHNIPEVISTFHNDTRKVFADVYIDDKSIVAHQSPLYWYHKLDLGLTGGDNLGI